ncbi:PA2169 family four-helix-bundle protein [Pseudomonas sp. Marseille-QA0892]
MDNPSVVSLLDSLIEACMNQEAWLRDCADSLNSGVSRRCIDSHAKSCALATNELQQMVRSLGSDPAEGRPVFGALRQQWLDVANLFSLTSHDGLLRECLRCEASTGLIYRHVLDQDLPANVRLMLERHYLMLLRCQDESKRLCSTG